MDIRRYVCVAIVLALVVGFGAVRAEEKRTIPLGRPDLDKQVQKKSAEKQDAPPQPGDPGVHHAHLERLVGSWEVRGRMWMRPDAEPAEFRGATINEMILQGRFLQQAFKGTLERELFLGLGIDGYDNVAGKYVGTWMDSMGTALMTFEGSCEDDGMVRTMYGSFTDPATGRQVKTKSVITVKSRSMYAFELWQEKADGKYFKAMEIAYFGDGAPKDSGTPTELWKR